MAFNSRKGQQTNQKYRSLVCSDQRIQTFEKAELRKADRTVGVNCYMFSNISSGTARLLQGIFTTGKRRCNLNNQDKILYSITIRGGPLKNTLKSTAKAPAVHFLRP